MLHSDVNLELLNVPFSKTEESRASPFGALVLSLLARNERLCFQGKMGFLSWLELSQRADEEVLEMEENTRLS